MVSLAGLSAVYPGQLAAQNQSNQNDFQELQLKDAKGVQQGQADFARGLMQALVPGAQAMPPQAPPQMAPQAPPPGQPSQPMRPPQPPPVAPPGPAAGGARGPQSGMPVGAPPGGAQQPGPPGGPPGGGAPPPGQGLPPQAQQLAGRVDLRSAMQGILKANPGIQQDPQRLYYALKAGEWILNDQAKEQLAQMRQQMQQMQLDYRRDALDERAREADRREDRMATQEEGRNRRADQSADTRAADREERAREADQRSADKRYGIDQIYKSKDLDRQTKFDIAQLSAKTKQEIADQLEAGRNNRAELSAETRRELLGMSLQSRQQLQQYMEAQRNARLDTQEAGRDRRQEVSEAGKEQRQGVAEAGKKERLDETEAGKSTRQAVSEAGKGARLDTQEAGKDTRSAAGIASREKINEERLDFGDRWKGVQREQHEQDRTSRENIATANRESRERVADKRLDLATAREARLSQAGSERLKQQQAKLDQQKKEAEARIARGDRTGQLAILQAVAKAQHTLDMEIISSYSFNTKLKPAERAKLVEEATKHRDDELAQIQNMAKLGGGTTSPTPQGGGDAPPVSMLKEGMVTTFENGQKWTLRNGKPEKVQ